MCCVSQELLEPHFGPCPRALGAHRQGRTAWCPAAAEAWACPPRACCFQADHYSRAGLAKTPESSTTSDKCSFGNSSGIPCAVLPGWNVLSCPLQQWHGEGQGKAPPRLGDMGQCGSNPSPLFASAPLSQGTHRGFGAEIDQKLAHHF